MVSVNFFGVCDMACSIEVSLCFRCLQFLATAVRAVCGNGNQASIVQVEHPIHNKSQQSQAKESSLIQSRRRIDIVKLQLDGRLMRTKSTALKAPGLRLTSRTIK